MHGDYYGIAYRPNPTFADVECLGETVTSTVVNAGKRHKLGNTCFLNVRLPTQFGWRYTHGSRCLWQCIRQFTEGKEKEKS
ncbi:hypothetical protein ACS0TY_008310 [Phlomoides rotata]